MYKIIYPITTQYKMCSPLIPEIYVHRHTNHTTCCFKVLVIIRSKQPFLITSSIKVFKHRVEHFTVAENVKMGVIDPDVYATQLEELRPHTQTLMQLLSQIRPKLRAMDSGDPRIPTYKYESGYLYPMIILGKYVIKQIQIFLNSILNKTSPSLMLHST